MSDVNTVIYSGRLAKNPELRRTASGVSVTDLVVASNRYSKDRRQFTTFARCTLWDKQAEWAAESLGVGDTVFVEGQLVDDNFESETGKTSGRLKIDNLRCKLISKATPKDVVEETTPVEDVPVA